MDRQKDRLSKNDVQESRDMQNRFYWLSIPHFTAGGLLRDTTKERAVLVMVLEWTMSVFRDGRGLCKDLYVVY